MSRWNDHFQNHAFRTNWSSLKATLEEKDLEKNNDITATKELARLQKVVAYVDSIIDQVDPELIASTALDSLNQSALNCLQHLNAFKGDQNIGHLNNANNFIDQIITVCSQTPFVLNGQQKGSLGKAAKAYSLTIDRYLERLNKEIEAEIETVKSNVVTLKNSISENKNSLSSLQDQLQAVAQTIQKQTAEFNTQFQANEKTRFDKFESISERLQNNADERFKELSTRAATTLAILARFQDDAAKVFGVVVNTMQAGAYSSYANEEKRTANFLRRSAITLMILGVAILVVPELAKIFKDIANYALDWRVTLGRVPFSFILFVPAFYLARESNRHRNNEVLNRRRELILSTIDPYLALLDKEKAEEIKVEIAKVVFSEGSMPAEPVVNDSSNVIAQIANLVKQFHK